MGQVKISYMVEDKGVIMPANRESSGLTQFGNFYVTLEDSGGPTGIQFYNRHTLDYAYSILFNDDKIDNIDFEGITNNPERPELFHILNNRDPKGNVWSFNLETGRYEQFKIYGDSGSNTESILSIGDQVYTLTKHDREHRLVTVVEGQGVIDAHLPLGDAGASDMTFIPEHNLVLVIAHNGKKLFVFDFDVNPKKWKLNQVLDLQKDHVQPEGIHWDYREKKLVITNEGPHKRKTMFTYDVIFDGVPEAKEEKQESINEEEPTLPPPVDYSRSRSQPIEVLLRDAHDCMRHLTNYLEERENE